VSSTKHMLARFRKIYKPTYWLAPEAAAVAGVLAAAAAAAAAPLLVSAVLPVAASPFITPLLASAALAAEEVSALPPLSDRLQPAATLSNTIAATISALLPTLCLDSWFITLLRHQSAR
jgi:hypothetical protein